MESLPRGQAAFAACNAMVGTGRFQLPKARLRLAPLAGWMRSHFGFACVRRLGCFVGRPQTETRPSGRICCMQCNGRDGQIRTADPSHPKRVLYQAEPRPDTIKPTPESRLLGS